MSADDDRPDGSICRPSFWRGVDRIAAIFTIVSFFGFSNITMINPFSEGFAVKRRETTGASNLFLREPIAIQDWVYAGSYRANSQLRDKKPGSQRSLSLDKSELLVTEMHTGWGKGWNGVNFWLKIQAVARPRPAQSN